MAEEIDVEVKVETKEVSALMKLLDKVGDKVKSVFSGFGKALENVGNKFMFTNFTNIFNRCNIR